MYSIFSPYFFTSGILYIRYPYKPYSLVLRLGENMFLAKVSSKFQITIPKEVRESLGIRPGDYVAFIIKDNEVVMRKAKIEI